MFLLLPLSQHLGRGGGGAGNTRDLCYLGGAGGGGGGAALVLPADCLRNVRVIVGD